MGLTPPAPGIWFPPWVCLVPAAHSALYTIPILYTNTIPRARVWQIIHGSWQIIHRLCSAYTPFTALAAHGRTLTSLAALNALRGLLAPYRYISILRRRACAVVVGFPRVAGGVLSIGFMRAAQFPLLVVVGFGLRIDPVNRIRFVSPACCAVGRSILFYGFIQALV